MTLILLAAAIGAACILVIGALVMPTEVRQGSFLALAVVLLAGGSSQTVPPVVADVAVAGAVLCLLVSIVSSRTRASPLRNPVVLLGGVLFAVGIAVTAVEIPSATVLPLRIAVLGLLTAMATAGLTRRGVHVVLLMLTILACGEVALAFVEVFVTGAPIPWGRKPVTTFAQDGLANKILGGGLVRAEGTLGHPIPFGLVASLPSLFVAIRWSSTRPAARAFFVGVSLSGVLLSGSRSVLLGLALALVYLIVSRRAVGRGVRILSLLACLTATVLVFSDEIGAFVAETIETGSYTNRVSALDSVPGLLLRGGSQTLLGSGWGSEIDLIAAGLLSQNGFVAVDNELVTLLATSGVVGVVLLVALAIVAFVQGDRSRRALLLPMFVMVFTFDFLAWNSIAALFFLMLALPRSAPEDAGETRHAASLRPWQIATKWNAG